MTVNYMIFSFSPFYVLRPSCDVSTSCGGSHGAPSCVCGVGRRLLLTTKTHLRSTKMSACSDFAEHVWKPGSCKNCFHPLSAHRKTAGGLGGSAPTPCSKGSQGGDEEAGLTSPSPYTKPTIAVKPTMMSLDNDPTTDVNMNIEQVSLLTVCFFKMGHKPVISIPTHRLGCRSTQRAPWSAWV